MRRAGQRLTSLVSTSVSQAFGLTLLSLHVSMSEAAYRLLKVREKARIVSVAVIVAVGVNADGRLEVLEWTLVPPRPRRFGASCPAAIKPKCSPRNSL